MTDQCESANDDDKLLILIFHICFVWVFGAEGLDDNLVKFCGGGVVDIASE